MTAVLPVLADAPGARRVRFLPGDLLGVVAAEYLRADAAAVPISANDAVERRLGEAQNHSGENQDRFAIRRRRAR